MLTGKTMLITGGGRGIGLAIAERAASLGASLILTGRTVASVAPAAERLGGRAMGVDLGDRASITELVRALEGTAVDVLVNNAGIAESAPIHRTDDAMFDRIMQVNVHGPFALMRALIPTMIARGFGRVVNVASNAGRAGYAYTSAYCASKHALVGLTRAVAAEIARTSVTINAVCPGWVDTDMSREATQRIADKTRRTQEEAIAELAAMSPQKRLIQPAEVAHLVVSLCAPEARGIHGQSILLDGGQVMA